MREKYILPIGSGCLVITDHTDHQNSQYVDTNPVGDIQTVENFPTQMNHHHQNNLRKIILSYLS